MSRKAFQLIPVVHLGILNFLVLISIIPSLSTTQGFALTPNATTWTVSNQTCLNPPSGCSCPINNESYTLIKCQCLEENQVVKLEGSKDPRTFFEPKTTTWIIESCCHVFIHQEALSAVNGNVKWKWDFELQLINIATLEIQESAFDLNSLSVTINLIFNNVSMMRIPTKAFPSNLDSIKFLNCDITTISSMAFRSSTLQNVIFDNTNVGLIESEAFYEGTLINTSWVVNNSEFKLIESRGIASSITNMTWADTRIDRLESYAMSGIIPNSSFVRNTFGHVATNGLTLKDWSWITLVNNSFTKVEFNGIDLTQHASSFNMTELQGNEWHRVETDFIKVGVGDEIPFTLIQENRFMEQCNCSSPFISQLTKKNSNDWFMEQWRNNTLCLTTVKGATCLGRTETETLISFSDWESLCTEPVFLCLNELSDVSDVAVYNPPSTGRLRILAIFIGTMGLAIVVALVGVLCVYLCRTKKPRRGKEAESDDDVHITKSLRIAENHNHHHNHAYSGMLNTKVLPKVSAPSTRPRSMLFEDVEMEDKGVQTMPSELSTEVLEGLRDKLTDPNSFWDAKETIDHLYDLIHVREEPGSRTLSASPPDVTISSPGNSHMSTSTTSTTSTSHLLSNAGSPAFHSTPKNGKIQSNRKPETPPRYAQIRPKQKTASICDYRDPSDSQTHIYSELTGAKPRSTSNAASTTGNGVQLCHAETGPDHGGGGLSLPCPIICEYTEPKDVQAHVYAELNPSPTSRPPLPPQAPGKSFSVQRVRPRPPVLLRASKTQTMSPKSVVSGPIDCLDNASQRPKSPTCQQRPLPSIPPPSSTQINLNAVVGSYQI